MSSAIKVISYSLWGNNQKYIIGAQKNIELAKKFFPDWKVKIYISTNTNFNYKSENLEIIYRTENQSQEGCFWRFEACDSDDVVIIRDLDDRLSERHKFVVDEWLNSDKDFHIMRDHPYHTTEILGGMWGCKNGVLKNIKNLINEYTKGNFWQVDQNFLKEKIYPMVKNNSLIHDSFLSFEKEKKEFPTKRKDKEFVGDVFDEFDKRHPEYYKFII
jgi:hypothetical protein